jgi:hypothetical protein
MPLLNYSTSISADKTVGEIQAKLARAGAHQILHEYGNDGLVTALSFRILTRFGEMAFRLPANIEAVEGVLRKQFPRRQQRGGAARSRDQATRVGWRILKTWTEAQLALIQTGMVTVEQVFLPYVQDSKGVTLYEALQDRKFVGFALEDKK